MVTDEDAGIAGTNGIQHKIPDENAKPQPSVVVEELAAWLYKKFEAGPSGSSYYTFAEQGADYKEMWRKNARELLTLLKGLI